MKKKRKKRKNKQGKNGGHGTKSKASLARNFVCSAGVEREEWTSLS